MIGELKAGGTTSNDDLSTKIKSRFLTSINNTTINENNIKNILTTIIRGSFKVASENKCNMDTTSGNEMDIDNILAATQKGERANITVKQSVSLKAFNKCLVDLDMGTKIIKKIMDFDISFFTPTKEDEINLDNNEKEQKVDNKEQKVDNKEQKVDNKENNKNENVINDVIYTTVKSTNDTMWECRLKGSDFSKKEKKCPSTKISCSCNGKTEIIKNNKEQFSYTVEQYSDTVEHFSDTVEQYSDTVEHFSDTVENFSDTVENFSDTIENFSDTVENFSDED
jgi:hypothetical protein